MIVGALLQIWLGFGNSQTITVTPMPDMATCNRAISALVEANGKYGKIIEQGALCIPVPPA